MDTFEQSVKDIVNSENFQEDKRFQYKEQGKLFQIVAKIDPEDMDQHNKAKRPIYVAVIVDHTPDSKYTGQQLRQIRNQKGIGA